MTRKGCGKRVCLAPDASEKPSAASAEARFGAKRARGGGRKGRHSGSPSARLFRYVRVNVAKALGLLGGKRASAAKCSNNTVAPQCCTAPRDSIHAETLEDCIEFINSSYRKSI